MEGITALIAAIVAMITIRQYLLSKERLRLDLFDRRFKIFEKIESFLQDVVAARTTSDQLLQEFDANTKTAIFLFGKDVTDFIEEVRNSATKEMYYRREQSLVDETSLRIESGDKRRANLEWFMDQQKTLKDRFVPYLEFRKSKVRFFSGIAD